ncbi:hypothetical protein CYMTET_35424 [Cymbomonas tetramitiformis]|uniref:Uncharacterized protein n=1 Tax=Cymbomonas tetramitiformis TaxID=36881 RepID=A0AAE0KNY7_9CHLO|nr:hypothetical protein CYMTET_35424 [Cymbomonas tetramitiformis]
MGCGRRGMGAIWDSLWVNGLNKGRGSWADIVEDEWMHLHLRSTRAYIDDVNVMSRVITGEEPAIVPGATAGKLASVFQWGNAMTDSDIANLGKGVYGTFVYSPYSMTLLHWYAIEEGEGVYLWDWMNPELSQNRGQLFPR